MSAPGFVDASDPAQVAAVLGEAFGLLGVTGVIDLLAGVRGLQVVRGRPGSLLRSEQPARVGYGEEAVVLGSRSARREHVVGGITLSSDELPPREVPVALARVVVRAVADFGGADDLAVRLTALRDALAAGS